MVAQGYFIHLVRVRKDSFCHKHILCLLYAFDVFFLYFHILNTRLFPSGRHPNGCPCSKTHRAGRYISRRVTRF